LEENDGDKAVELVRKRNKEKNEENINLIIMDLNMLKMDGDFATK
jgi:CheY-like chemotaxis protein